MKLWKYFEENPLFAHTYEHQTLNQLRELTVRRINTIFGENFIKLSDVSFIISSDCFILSTKKNMFIRLTISFGLVLSEYLAARTYAIVRNNYGCV